MVFKLESFIQCQIIFFLFNLGFKGDDGTLSPAFQAQLNRNTNFILAQAQDLAALRARQTNLIISLNEIINRLRTNLVLR